MHVILRRYAGAADRMAAASEKVQQGLVPLLRGHMGFEGYAAFASEQGDIVSCTIYANAQTAAQSHEQVRGWVQTHLKGIMPEAPPAVSAGEVMHHAMRFPQSGGQGQSLYCMVREYQGVPAEEEIRPIVEKTVAALQRDEGFRGVYVLRTPQDSTRLTSVLFCDSETTVDRLFREITQATLPPGMTQRVLASGPTSVLAMA